MVDTKLEKITERLGANIPSVVVAEAKSSWANKITLHIPTSQMKKLRKGCVAHMLSDGQWYQLIPNEKVTVKVGNKKFRLTPDQAMKLQKSLGA